MRRGRARPRGRLKGRLFNHFIWGGYILYAWPEQRVFIDGGTDYYGEAVFKEYLRSGISIPAGTRYSGSMDISLTLVPPQSRLAHELVRDRQWTIWYCDSTAAILRPPTGDQGPETTSPADSALLRCGAAPTGPQ